MIKLKVLSVPSSLPKWVQQVCEFQSKAFGTEAERKQAIRELVINLDNSFFKSREATQKYWGGVRKEDDFGRPVDVPVELTHSKVVISQASLFRLYFDRLLVEDDSEEYPVAGQLREADKDEDDEAIISSMSDGKFDSLAEILSNEVMMARLGKLVSLLPEDPILSDFIEALQTVCKNEGIEVVDPYTRHPIDWEYKTPPPSREEIYAGRALKEMIGLLAPSDFRQSPQRIKFKRLVGHLKPSSEDESAIQFKLSKDVAGLLEKYKDQLEAFQEINQGTNHNLPRRTPLLHFLFFQRKELLLLLGLTLWGLNNVVESFQSTTALQVRPTENPVGELIQGLLIGPYVGMPLVYPMEPHVNGVGFFPPE